MMIRVWVGMMRERGLRRGAAESLRCIADRIGPEDAFVGGSMTMYLVKHKGWVLDPDAETGHRIWYRQCEYDGEIYPKERWSS